MATLPITPALECPPTAPTGRLYLGAGSKMGGSNHGKRCLPTRLSTRTRHMCDGKDLVIITKDNKRVSCGIGCSRHLAAGRDEHYWTWKKDPPRQRDVNKEKKGGNDFVLYQQSYSIVWEMSRAQLLCFEVLLLLPPVVVENSKFTGKLLMMKSRKTVDKARRLCRADAKP